MNKKTIGNIVITLIVVFIMTFGGYRYNKVKQYNKLITDANKHMELGEYDKAIDLFEKSLKYKNDSDNKGQIQIAKKLKVMKKSYENGIKLMNNNKYIDAIKKFEKIDKENKKIYSNSQENIKSCKDKYITTKINDTQKFIGNKNFNEANKCLDEVLKVDSNNKQANSLKNSIAKMKKNEEKPKIQKTQVKKKEIKKVLSKDDAINIIKRKFLSNEGSNMRYEYDHDSIHDGKNFYVIHVYSNMGTHTATMGWYGVEKTTGRIYNELFSKYEN